MKVYLAGGMAGDWREKVRERFRLTKNIVFFDPTSTQFKDPKHYTNWDLKAIDRCDVLFAYLEDSNPSGLGMSAEIGYAKALNKIIIFVNEQVGNKYTPFLRECSDYYEFDLDGGMDCLSQVNWLLRRT